MNTATRKPPTVLEKAKAESMSDKDFETFRRVEKRVTAGLVARLSASINGYRSDAVNMTPAEIIREKHSSSRLGRYLRADGHPRPAARWDAHHIVSGEHPRAMESRAILADPDIAIRIDDPDNGCWMPKTKADARPTIYPNAIGHNRIHRELYFNWILNGISMLRTEGQVRAYLNTVRAQLLQGNIRPEMKLQQEIDEVEYKNWLKKNRKL